LRWDKSDILEHHEEIIKFFLFGFVNKQKKSNKIKGKVQVPGIRHQKSGASPPQRSADKKSEIPV
jgi:hypothetical protein